MAQGIHENVRTLATVESELHFSEVGREVLCADLMPRAYNAALQEGEGILYGVGMNIAININMSLVFDCPMAALHSSCFHRSGIGVEFVCNNHLYVFTNIFPDELGECSRLRIGRMKETNWPPALTDTNYNLL